MRSFASAFLCLLAPAFVSAEQIIVQPGDTLARIAWSYSISPAALRTANGLNSDTLRPGTPLTIPDRPIAKAVPVVASPQPTPHVPPPEVRRAQVITAAVPPVPAVAVLSAAAPPAEAPKPQPFATPPKSDSSFSQERLLSLARSMDAKSIGYGASWRPPGQTSAWEMDCSNTARYVLLELTGNDIGRTASEQYTRLAQARKLHRVRSISGKLLAKLKPGDLLFWENTYKPVRKPPITHVMIFLGRGENGYLMFGSQSSRSGGPGIYPFDPERNSGGFSTWFGLIKHPGKFVAYASPMG